MIAILIPVYKPEDTFEFFLKQLSSAIIERKADIKLVIVNDGNSPELLCFKNIPKENVHFVHHFINLGKGRALKSGINYCLNTFPDIQGCVTCDADGQHSVDDILKISEILIEKPNCLILGCRTFGKDVPFRSRFGNKLTSFLFRFLAGMKISDTQTGLRGLPIELMKICLNLEGERYEFETNMLLQCKKNNILINEERIKTIYCDDNKSSHFHPIFDSLKIYGLLFKFIFSSCVSSVIDFIIFSITYFFSKRMFLSLVMARIVSIFVNFIINKNLVFSFGKHKNKREFLFCVFKYCCLAIFLFCGSYFGIKILTNLTAIPIYLSKIIVETMLFLISYNIQRDYIFKKK